MNDETTSAAGSAWITAAECRVILGGISGGQWNRLTHQNLISVRRLPGLMPRYARGDVMALAATMVRPAQRTAELAGAGV